MDLGQRAVVRTTEEQAEQAKQKKPEAQGAIRASDKEACEDDRCVARG